MEGDNMGRDWLAENDPEYVSPAMKGAITRKTEFDGVAFDDLVALQSGSSCIKQGGVHRQSSLVGFSCDSDGENHTIDPVDFSDAADPFKAALLMEFKAQAVRRGKRGGKRGNKKRPARKKK